VCNFLYFYFHNNGKIFWLKRDEITGGWRKLHNEELNNLYSLPSIIRIIKPSRMRWAGQVTRMREKGNACTVLLGKHEETTRKTTHRWEDNIKLDIREIGWCGVDEIHPAQYRDQWRALVNMVLNLWVPLNFQKFFSR
jgi:hypothetical protein